MMDIVIKKVDSKITDDFLTFFENISTIDKSVCGKCCCMFFHTDENAKEWIDRNRESNKNDAVEFIKAGTLSGFLAYDGKKPIAWCNANERDVYKFNKSRFSVSHDDKRVVSIVCFYIMKAYRGKGITAVLLRHIIVFFKSESYDYLEAYPSTSKTKCDENYHGPLSTFLKNGFSVFKEMEEVDDFGDYEKYDVVRYYFK